MFSVLPGDTSECNNVTECSALPLHFPAACNAVKGLCNFPCVPSLQPVVASEPQRPLRPLPSGHPAERGIDLPGLRLLHAGKLTVAFVPHLQGAYSVPVYQAAFLHILLVKGVVKPVPPVRQTLPVPSCGHFLLQEFGYDPLWSSWASFAIISAPSDSSRDSPP